MKQELLNLIKPTKEKFLFIFALHFIFYIFNVLSYYILTQCWFYYLVHSDHTQ